MDVGVQSRMSGQTRLFGSFFGPGPRHPETGDEHVIVTFTTFQGSWKCWNLAHVKDIYLNSGSSVEWELNRATPKASRQEFLIDISTVTERSFMQQKAPIELHQSSLKPNSPFLIVDENIDYFR